MAGRGDWGEWSWANDTVRVVRGARFLASLNAARPPFLRHHRAGGRRRTPMQIWLILAVVGTAPIHVGNFPDMDTCQAAAMSSRGQVTGARPRSMSHLWMCVQANTGKPNDPLPP